MNQKLTLSIDSAVVDAGKRFASRSQKSLSRLVEDYLLLLGGDGAVIDDVPISSKLKSLVGIGSGSYDEHDHRAHLERRNA